MRRAEVRGLLRGGLWEAKVLRSDICLSMKDKWRRRRGCRITCFYFCCPSSLVGDAGLRIILELRVHLSGCFFFFYIFASVRSRSSFDCSYKWVLVSEGLLNVTAAALFPSDLILSFVLQASVVGGKKGKEKLGFFLVSFCCFFFFFFVPA